MDYQKIIIALVMGYCLRYLSVKRHKCINNNDAMNAIVYDVIVSIINVFYGIMFVQKEWDIIVAFITGSVIGTYTSIKKQKND